MKKHLIKQVFLYWDLLILAGILAIGIFLCFLKGGWGAIGFIVIASDVFMAPFVRHGYKIEGHPGTFRLEEVPVPRECENQILSYLDDESLGLDVRPVVFGGAIVNVYHNKRHNTLLAQYFEYTQLLNGVEYPMVNITQHQLETLRKIQSPK